MQPISKLKENLPIRYDLTLSFVLSLIIAFLMTVASVVSLVLRASVYPTEELSKTFIPNDLINLIIGLPLLLLAMWLARRGQVVGLLCWPGALFFIVYNYIAYLFAVPLSAVFLLHMVLVALSIYSMILLLASISPDEAAQLLRASVPNAMAAGVLAPLGAIFFIRVIVVIIQSFGARTPMPQSELAVNVADFLVTPSWIIGGILLWFKKPFGYIAALGLLFQASMLFISLILFMLLQPILTSSPIPAWDIVIVCLMGMACFVPTVLFARGVMAKQA